jgi:hypothetical protein
VKNLTSDPETLLHQGRVASTVEPIPNPGNSAIYFLWQLDFRPEAAFHITTLTDLPKGVEKPSSDPLLRQYEGLTLAEVELLLPELARLNEAGAGIFFCVNQCRGKRKKENVTRVRCVHADFDSASQLQIDAVRQKLPPSIEVRTSVTNKCHMYWVLDDADELDVPTAEGINRALVDLGADPAATDVSRLLRLPGFRHMKYRSIGEIPLVTATFSEEQSEGVEQ